MITGILERVAALERPLRAIAERLMYIDVVTGLTDPPAPMEPWIVRQFGSLAAVRRQTIVKITNRLTLEGAVFNLVRSMRPSEPTGGDAELEEWIAGELAALDLFSRPLQDTTADTFGRIRGRFCTTAANVARCDGWHGLVIFDEPHPLRFGREQLRDYLEVALRWLGAAHQRDPAAIYPAIFWNCLPKSGATQMHGHMQLALAHGMHYARVEQWRRAAATYRQRYGANYFDDLYALHAALGLALPAGPGLRRFAHLTPLRNHETVILHAQEALAVPAALADLIYDSLRALIERRAVRAFNVTIALPPFGAHRAWRDVPAIVRLVDRGNPLTRRSDWGAFEMFLMGCVLTDPYDTAAAVRGDTA